jgi:ECF sigma factor
MSATRESFLFGGPYSNSGSTAAESAIVGLRLGLVRQTRIKRRRLQKTDQRNNKFVRLGSMAEHPESRNRWKLESSQSPRPDSNWTWRFPAANLLGQEVSRVGRGESLPEDSSRVVRQLLADWHAGDSEAARAVVPVVYVELRRVAKSYLRKERIEHTLQSTALVHELTFASKSKVPPRSKIAVICWRSAHS